MRLKYWIVSCAMFAACLAACQPAFVQEFKGKAIFSVEVVEWSQMRNADGSKGPKERTGVFYYLEDARIAADHYLPMVTGYKLQNGKVVDQAGMGSVETEAFLRKLRDCPLSAFNVQDEIDTVIAKLRANGVPNGAGVLDGTKYRIRYEFNGVSIDHTGWNPGNYIRELAPHSEKLKNLNDVLDLFALNYGQSQLGL